MNTQNKLQELVWNIEKYTKEKEDLISQNDSGAWDRHILHLSSRLNGIYEAVSVLKLRDELESISK